MKNKFIIVGCIVLVLAAAAPSVYFYSRWRESEKKASDPQLVAKERVAETIEKLSKFMELPAEEPTLATVSDVTKFVNQPFFAKAKNGDQVLVFQAAKLAILYDPLANKIVNVAPVNIGTPSAAPATAGVRFAIYNGTSTVGLTRTYEAILLDKIPTAEVVAKENAKKRDYEESILIDLTGAQSTKSTELAATLDLEVGTLPAGEAKPDGADFLIILGAEQK